MHGTDGAVLPTSFPALVISTKNTDRCDRNYPFVAQKPCTLKNPAWQWRPWAGSFYEDLVPVTVTCLGTHDQTTSQHSVVADTLDIVVQETYLLRL